MTGNNSTDHEQNSCQFISISSLDYASLLTLVKLVPRSWPTRYLGPLVLHPPASDIPIVQNSAEAPNLGTAPSQRWWFGEYSTVSDGVLRTGAASDAEFITACYHAFSTRRRNAMLQSSNLNLIDQKRSGIVLQATSATMLEAICVARTALVHAIPVSAAEIRVQACLRAAHPDMASLPRDAVDILLCPEDLCNSNVGARGDDERGPHVQVGEAASLSPSEYRTYLRHLYEAVENQIRAGRYASASVIRVSHHEPYVQTLKRITDVVRAHCAASDSSSLVSSAASPTPLAAPSNAFRYLLQTVRCIVALGGLSECGKSTTATLLVSRHNARSAARLSTLDLGRSGGAFRLKLVYIEKVVSARLLHSGARGVYEVSAEERAIEVVHELDTFAQVHRSLEMITLESLHDYESTRCLQEFIGNRSAGGGDGESVSVPTCADKNETQFSKLCVVYLDTPLNIRRDRTVQQGAVFDPEKDALKVSRGADKIRGMADMVLSNDGTQLDTCVGIERYIGNYSYM